MQSGRSRFGIVMDVKTQLLVRAKLLILCKSYCNRHFGSGSEQHDFVSLYFSEAELIIGI